MEDANGFIKFLAETIQNKVKADLAYGVQSRFVLSADSFIIIEEQKGGYHIYFRTKQSALDKHITTLDNFENVLLWIYDIEKGL